MQQLQVIAVVVEIVTTCYYYCYYLQLLHEYNNINNNYGNKKALLLPFSTSQSLQARIKTQITLEYAETKLA